MMPTRPAPLLTAPPDPLVGTVRNPQPDSTSSPRKTPATSPPSVALIPVDIYTDDHRIYLRAELPGIDPSTLQIQPHAGCLTLFASVKALAAGGPSSDHLLGRQIPLPGCGTSTTVISEDYALGILTLVLLCAENAGGLPISIPVN